MPPFVAKAANAAGAELELPAKVQELLAGWTPHIILPCNDQCNLVGGGANVWHVAAWHAIQRVPRHAHCNTTRRCCDPGPGGELPEALQRLEPQILEMVCSEILEGGSGCSVSWDDIAGQDRAKRLVQELVVWPMLNPHLFKARCPHRITHPCEAAFLCAQC